MKRRPARRPHQSPEWAKMRANHLLTYPECRVCGTTENVVVHHLRYRMKGAYGRMEKPGDLMTLCNAHHWELHQSHRGGDLAVHTLAFVRAMAS